MAMSYEELTALITTNPTGYHLIKYSPDGREHHFSGREISSFLAGRDGRAHEHKVFTVGGELVYHRDINGRVHVGSAGQFAAAERKRSIGSILLWGMRGKPDGAAGNAVRRGIRIGLGGRWRD